MSKKPVEHMDKIQDLFAEGALGPDTPENTPGTAHHHPLSPKSARAGDVWLNKTDGSTYVYYTDTSTSSWIQVGGSAK